MLREVVIEFVMKDLDKDEIEQKPWRSEAQRMLSIPPYPSHEPITNSEYRCINSKKNRATFRKTKIDYIKLKAVTTSRQKSRAGVDLATF